MESKAYFIVSCARSGSTSLTHILDMASNSKCLVEPSPNLNVETRDMMEGRIDNPREIVVKNILPRVAKVLDQGWIYGEKNLTLGPFIPYLYEMMRCKFVWLIRDGRDVARSLINWHNEAFGNIYRECKETSTLSKIAQAAVKRLPISKDTSDYARPRPQQSDPFYDEWSKLSRFEMATWYWAFINRLYKTNLSQIPDTDWLMLDYTKIKAEDIKRVYEFLGLCGYDRDRVQDMLNTRINSIETRFGLEARFPEWTQWDEACINSFDRIAADMMRELGYYG